MILMERFDNYIKSANLSPKAHQREAVEWCVKHETTKFPLLETRGGIIADEMGLGKTVVMMGLIVTNFLKKTLIVLPVALIDQWRREIARTMNHDPLVFHGEQKRESGLNGLKNAPIVLTTYGHIIPSAKSDINILHEIEWDRIIFDEAHHLRNMNTQIHIGASSLKSSLRWLITGTPIQNSRNDFYSLCAAMGMKSSYYSDEKQLKTIVKNFILKRTKKDVGIELPSLYDEKVVVPWESESEKQLAQDIHSRLSFSGVSPSQGDNFIAGLELNVLQLLVKARQTCIYPKLLEKHVDKFMKDGVESQSKFLKGTKNSSKLNAVVNKIIERKTFGKKLIFCHYRGEIDTLSEMLIEKKFSVATFDGRTTSSRRDEILTGNNDILILQIQTGCEGLNLQTYNEVYFVSPHWNPSIEDQAVARCHRIGQKQDVFVWRFVLSLDALLSVMFLCGAKGASCFVFCFV